MDIFDGGGNLRHPEAPDLTDITNVNNLQYDGADQQGVMFHLVSALSQH